MKASLLLLSIFIFANFDFLQPNKIVSTEEPADPSSNIIYYDELPNWLKQFLELYFPSYFPPKNVTPVVSQVVDNIPDTPMAAVTVDQFGKNLVAIQNRYRAAVGLKPLKWDEQLAKFSFNYAKNQDLYENCRFEHSSFNSRSKVGPYTYIGENLYMSTGFQPNEERIIYSWYNEINCYKYGKVGNKCTIYQGPNCNMKTVMVGHFTQMMWDSATHAGCSIVNCLSCTKLCPMFFVGCNYGSTSSGYGGNLVGQYPFPSSVAKKLNLPFCEASDNPFSFNNTNIDTNNQKPTSDVSDNVMSFLQLLPHLDILEPSKLNVDPMEIMSSTQISVDSIKDDLVNKNKYMTTEHADITNQDMTNEHADITNKDMTTEHADITNKDMRNEHADITNKDMSNEHADITYKDIEIENANIKNNNMENSQSDFLFVDNNDNTSLFI